MTAIEIFAAVCGGLIVIISVYLVFQVVKYFKCERKKPLRKKDVTTYTYYEKDENTLTIEL